MKKYIQIRNELTVYLVYLQLMTSLTPKEEGGIANRDVRTGLIETSEFLKKANENEMVKKGPVLIKHLQEAAEPYQKSFPPKLSIEQIAEEFNGFFSKNKGNYSPPHRKIYY
jgi:hypothetical protein